LQVQPVDESGRPGAVSGSDSGGQALPRGLVITPAGGAQKVPYMVALLTAQRLKVVVLLDDEPQARESSKDLVREKLIREENVVFVSESIEPPPSSADIEDILGSDVYNDLVAEAYSKELIGKSITLNPNIPRIVHRYDVAFRDHGIEFNKTRPARLFLKKNSFQSRPDVAGVSSR